MQVSQITLQTVDTVVTDLAPLAAQNPDWVLVFGAIPLLQRSADALAQAFPRAQRMGCSTAGEIAPDGVHNGSLVVTAVRFDSTTLRQASTLLQDMEDSFAAGQRLASALPTAGLRTVVVLGQGVHINGSAVISGMVSVLGPDVPISGGLAGDAGAFSQTWVLDNQGLSNQRVVCIGLYGPALGVSHGYYGGWSPFGPARKVTRAQGNVLLELDGEPALTLYKRYLGEHAKDLPASGLLFPFAMLGQDHHEVGLIRTILGMDERAGSLTLAGDIDPDGYLRMMHASTDALVAGASAAAQSLQVADHAGLALLVSCVGRKLVMGGRVNEEVRAVAQVVGTQTALAGFYSNGEISPGQSGMDSKLHNQTMTITYLSEAASAG